MSRPEHSMRFMQSKYRKYQFFALACALFTVLASLLAVFSGARVNTLVRTAEHAPGKVLDPAAAQELNEARQSLDQLRGQLNAEKDQNAALKARIENLEQRLAESRKTAGSAEGPGAARTAARALPAGASGKSSSKSLHPQMKRPAQSEPLRETPPVALPENQRPAAAETASPPPTVTPSASDQ